MLYLFCTSTHSAAAMVAALRVSWESSQLGGGGVGRNHVSHIWYVSDAVMGADDRDLQPAAEPQPQTNCGKRETLEGKELQLFLHCCSVSQK